MTDSKGKKDTACDSESLPPCHLILDILPAGLIMVGGGGRIETWNRAMEVLTGYPAEEVLGKRCTLECARCPHSGEDRAPDLCRFLGRMDQSDTGEVIDGCECVVRNKAGELVPVIKNARLVRDEKGNATALIETLTDLRPMKALEKDLAELRRSVGSADPVGRLVGSSKVMAEVYERIRLAAESDATVILLGETGTGKELVAEAIHTESDRGDHPFIKVNCSALPENLLEAELFGHVRGAFTGAVRDKVGRFEAADGGTLLLDEIGDISPMIQIKLLRVLQEREFERVGESAPRQVNVRVICATNRNLRKLVREGVFREDLFYRIRVFPIELPPLRKRKSDIPQLVDAFIHRFNLQTGKHLLGLEPNALNCFMDHCWPGNVRELENAIEHAFVVCQEDRIGLFDLPTEIRMVDLRTSDCREHAMNRSDDSSKPFRVAESREDFVRVLRECDWNQSETARWLEIDRSTVWRRMKRWGISPPD